VYYTVCYTPKYTQERPRAPLRPLAVPQVAPTPPTAPRAASVPTKAPASAPETNSSAPRSHRAKPKQKSSLGSSYLLCGWRHEHAFTQDYCFDHAGLAASADGLFEAFRLVYVAQRDRNQGRCPWTPLLRRASFSCGGPFSLLRRALFILFVLFNVLTMLALLLLLMLMMGFLRHFDWC